MTKYTDKMFEKDRYDSRAIRLIFKTKWKHKFPLAFYCPENKRH